MGLKDMSYTVHLKNENSIIVDSPPMQILGWGLSFVVRKTFLQFHSICLQHSPKQPQQMWICIKT